MPENNQEIRLDLKYLRQRGGLLKIVEIVFASISLGCITVAKKGFARFYPMLTDDRHESRFDFFLVVHVIGLLNVIAIFLINFFRMAPVERKRKKEGDNAKCWKYWNVCLCFIMVALCILCGGVMIADAKTKHEAISYSESDLKWNWYANNQIAAIVFSFFSSCVYFVDGMYLFRDWAERR